MDVVRLDADRRVTVVGRCHDFHPAPVPGMPYRVREPQPFGPVTTGASLSEDVLVHHQDWPVILVRNGASQWPAFHLREGGPDPTKLPGWSPA